MFEAINWNDIQDPLDKTVWERLTANFWLDTKIPVSNDLDSWGRMSEQEKEVVRKVFAELTLLDTLQSQVGVASLMPFAATPHEEAVYTNIQFMESVHAKSYSTIFSTLCSSEEINRLFDWVNTDSVLQEQSRRIKEWYEHDNPLYRFSASVMLESFLFYTGFYAALRFASEGKITNSADIIRLIMRDEGVHGFYIGHKFQQLREKYEEDDMDIEEEIVTQLHGQYILSRWRAEEIYDGVGWTEDVKKFLRYNANKTLANLGMEPMFQSDSTNVSAAILAALDPGTGETHDFFSGSGASYVVGKAEETDDEDWDW